MNHFWQDSNIELNQIGYRPPLDYAEDAEYASYASYAEYAKYAKYAEYADYAKNAEYAEYANYAKCFPFPNIFLHFLLKMS